MSSMEQRRLTRAIVALIAVCAPDPNEEQVLDHIPPPTTPRPEPRDPRTREGLKLYEEIRDWEAQRKKQIREHRPAAVQLLKVRWALDLLDLVEREDPR